VDARTDVWACAVVLYEMLCGRLPLEGPPYVVLRKLVAGDFPRPRELRPELPAELDDIIMQALAVEREARIGSCHEFGNALAGFLYATAPRFSSMSLSYLLKELFRQDLTVDGREARVPPSFLEELTAWRDAARGSKVSAVSQRLRPPRESLSEDDPPPAMSPEQAARFRNGMLALAGGVAALGIAVAAISSIPKAPPPAPVQELPWAVPPATSKAEPVPAAPAERAPAAPASAEAPPRRRPPARGSAKYPVDSIRLEAARDVVKPADTSATSQELDPRLTYQLYEEAPPCDGPPIFYLLSGEAPLTAEDSVGTLSERPITLQWVRKVTLFTVGEPPPSPGPRHVRLDELRPTGEPVQLESIKVNPLMSAASLARAFVLEGLSGSRTYELRLVAGEEGALVRGARGGRVRKVVCARQTGAAAAGPVDTARYGQLAKEQQFLLQPGRPARLEAARGVSCGFVDDDPSDNEGGLELHISEVSRH
jgi:serine/threonine-protein kinase